MLRRGIHAETIGRWRRHHRRYTRSWKGETPPLQADDALQTLTWLAFESQRRGANEGPFALIVVYNPAQKLTTWPNSSLVQSWLNEARTYIPRLVVHGSPPADAKLACACVYLPGVRAAAKRTGEGGAGAGKILLSDRGRVPWWVRGRQQESAVRLTFWRNTLVPRADAVYLLSGSVFPHTMRFDVVQTIKSLASPEKRAQWTVVVDNRTVHRVYTDAALDHLYEHWPEYSVAYKTNLLVPILLRRTAASKIDGVPVMRDHQADMINKRDGQIDIRTCPRR
jgi:hypothetical protein